MIKCLESKLKMSNIATACVHLRSLDLSSSKDVDKSKAGLSIGPCNDGECARCKILLKIELMGDQSFLQTEFEMGCN